MHDRGNGAESALRAAEPVRAQDGAATGDGAAPLFIVHNPTAGRRRRRFLAQVIEALAAAGVRPEIVVTEARGDAMRLARDGAASGAQTIVVAGGDGTINEAINGLAGTGSRLALIPLGTANVLAAELGLPETPEAIARIAAGHTARQIHLGEVAAGAQRRRFAMMAGVGFDAYVVANLSLPLKRAAGKLAYGWQTLIEWLRLRPRRYRIAADGVTFDCTSAIVAKGHFYAGRYVAAPEASLDRDSFELVLFERGGRLAVLRYALALGLGRLPKARGVRILRAREIVIESDAPAGGAEPVHADGDIVGTLPARFTIAKERLTVHAP